MMDDVRAAAERLRNHWDDDESCHADERMLAKAYLRDHLPDDGEAVTMEFVRQFSELADYIESESNRAIGVRVGEPIYLCTKSDVRWLAERLRDNR